MNFAPSSVHGRSSTVTAHKLMSSQARRPAFFSRPTSSSSPQDERCIEADNPLVLSSRQRPVDASCQGHLSSAIATWTGPTYGGTALASRDKRQSRSIDFDRVQVWLAPSRNNRQWVQLKTALERVQRSAFSQHHRASSRRRHWIENQGIPVQDYTGKEGPSANRRRMVGSSLSRPRPMMEAPLRPPTSSDGRNVALCSGKSSKSTYGIMVSSNAVSSDKVGWKWSN